MLAFIIAHLERRVPVHAEHRLVTDRSAEGHRAQDALLHASVMVAEVLEALQAKVGEVALDATLGSWRPQRSAFTCPDVRQAYWA